MYVFVCGIIEEGSTTADTCRYVDIISIRPQLFIFL